MDYDAMEQLVKLRDQKAITDDEFREQKRILLSSGPREVMQPSDDLERQIDLADNHRKLQKRRALIFGLGLCATVYSMFLYDTTVSPMDLPQRYSTVNAYSNDEDRSRAVSEITGRYNRLKAGARYETDERVGMQRAIFWVGLGLMLLGGVSYLLPILRNRR